MAFDLEDVFKAAVTAGITAAKPGGEAAEDWIKAIAKANEKSLKIIAEGMLNGELSKETGAFLLEESKRALESELLALQAILKATAQAAINAFFDSLKGALSTAINVAL